MRKHLNRVIVFLIMCICLTSFSVAPAVGAEKLKVLIPKPEKFMPNKVADEIETVVSNKSVIQCEAVDNKAYIDGEAVAKKNTEALAEIDGYIKELESKGMSLNRELINTVTVHIKKINFSEFSEIVIDNNNINKITDVDELKIVLQNSNEYITLSKASINYIAANYKEFKIQIKKLSGTYTIRFLDLQSSIIDKYETDIKLALPASHSEQTVYLFKDNVQENWGGQYNSAEKAIEVMTKYSGEYNVASPEIAINDVDALSDYEKQAIRFMVVRGYFSLDNKKFNPDSSLTRYDFAESLVRMFFALDSDAVCTFSDVDKKHYRYVAASEQSSIVLGFEDKTFRGKEKVTAEQVIALAARTINQKNGYVYPEHIDEYLKFEASNTISEWAKKEIALASREGIYSHDMNFKFSEGITRKDAAVVLYRLFMIMNNTPDVVETAAYSEAVTEYHETFWNKTNAIIVGVAFTLINIIALVISVIVIKKKKCV